MRRVVKTGSYLQIFLVVSLVTVICAVCLQFQVVSLANGEDVAGDTKADRLVQTTEQLSDMTTVLQRLEQAWAQVTTALPGGKISEVHEGLKVVLQLQREAGIGGLQEYSNALIKEALNRKTKKDLDGARYLLRKALELSPRSPEIRFNSITLGSALGEFSGTKGFLDAVALIPSDPSFCVKLLLQILNPVAWAVTIGVYLSLLIFCFFWIVDLLRQAAQFFPIRYRGLYSPLFTAVLLFLPVPLGPVISIVVWALFLWILDRRRKWALISAASVLVVWGFVSPIRERLGAWFEKPGNQVLLSYSSGTLGGADRYLLEQLTKDVSTPGAAWFAYGQLLRRYGDYPSAMRALDAAQRILQGEGTVASEKAVVLALMGDADAALKEMKAAEELGVSSVEHYYNYSRVAAEALDTAGSRDFLRKAGEKNNTVVSALRAREDLLGSRHPSGYANVRLPLAELLSSLWDDSYAPQKYRASVLSLGLSPFVLVIVGMVLLLLAAVPIDRKSRRRLSPYYSGYQPSSTVLFVMRIIPGGPWAMRQNPLVAILFFSTGAFFVMPLVGWPSESRWMMELYPAWAPHYFTVLGAVTLLVVIIGFIRSEVE